MAKGSGRLRWAFQVCLELAQAHDQGRGPERKRGHPWVSGWDLYLALLPFRTSRRATYRHTGAVYQELFPERPCPSFQSLHRFAKRVEEELRRLFGRLRERLLPLLPQEEAPLLMDRTGLAHRSKGQPALAGTGHTRLLCLARYDRQGRLMALEGWRWARPTPPMCAWGSWLWGT